MLDQPGQAHIEVTGDDLARLSNEAGCHKIQRTPPTEKRGRVHTSAVTVAVLQEDDLKHRTYDAIESKDLKVEWYSGTGAGGQNRNKVQCSCRLTHIPTGIVKTSQTRSRKNSYKEAYASLIAELNASSSRDTKHRLGTLKSQQMGNGSNSNVIRTYCFQHGFVKNEQGEKIAVELFHRGMLDQLW